MKKRIFILLIFINSFCYGQVRILFDATKAEMAGNADWVIDADVFNLGTNFNGAMVAGHGDDSNPQNIPTLPQTNITSTTTETYWDGALSNWAIDLVKQGYEVQSLPYNDSITYGNSSHALDLSNYKVLIIDEPNILFSASQKTALVNFVQNGGGLFMISDHDVSDRNGDGFDSPYIWNDLFSNNGVQSNPFGMTFDLQNFSQTSTNITNLPGDSCLHGIAGDVTEIKYSNGTSISLDVIANPSAKGLIYQSGFPNSGNNNIMFARSRYGHGKVCALGDSSPPDDGTGDPNDFLYFSYTGEAHGSHQKLLVNSVIWLASEDASTGIQYPSSDNISLNVYPNPSHGNSLIKFNFNKPMDISFEVCDLSGRVVLKKENRNFSTGSFTEEIELTTKGFFLLRVISSEGVFSKSVIVN